MKTLKQLLEARAVAWDKGKALREKVAAEDRDFTGEERAQWDAIIADVESLSQRIEDEERSRSIDAAVSGAAPIAADPQEQQERGDAGGDTAEQYRAAFDQYLRRGMRGLDRSGQDLLDRHLNDEVRAQGTSPDTAGGYLVPEEFQNKLFEVIKSFGGLLAEADVLTTGTGAKMTWPKVDDTANKGVIVSENTQHTEQDIVFSNLGLDAYTFSSEIVRVSRQLLQDSAVNLNDLIPRLLGTRIGRALADYLITGTGTGQPEGILTGATSITSAATGAISYADLVKLEHSIDPAHRGRAKYMLSDDALAQLQLAVDAQDRPLWAPSIAVGVPSTINGRPYFVDQGMPDVDTGEKPIVYGDFKAGFVVRQVAGAEVLRLTERYADFLQVGFLGFARYDSGVQDVSAIKALEVA